MNNFLIKYYLKYNFKPLINHEISMICFFFNFGFFSFYFFLEKNKKNFIKMIFNL